VNAVETSKHENEAKEIAKKLPKNLKLL